MDQKRIVVTGMGTVNPLAHNVPDTWNGLINGKSGLARIASFDISTFTSQVGGEVKDFDYTKYSSDDNVAKARKMDPFIHYAAASTKEAVAMSGLDIKSDIDRIGICVGSGIGGLHIQQKNSAAWVQKGHKRISPFYIPGLIGNMCSGFLSMELGIMGPNLSTQTACATANHSIAVGMMIIQTGIADAMIVGGAESTINEMGFAGFCNMRALSTKYNETPEKASRPFDKGRDGFVMSEGAGILVLEDYEYAKKRGANILCEIASVGMTGDAHDMVMPHPEGLGGFKSMKMACDKAGVDPLSIDYINTHGTSTPLGDLGEAKAIRKLFNDNQDNVSVGSTKSMHGHLLGATAGIEAVACIMALKNNTVPPTINLDDLDTETGLTCVNTETLSKDVKLVLSNSFGFGGHNSTVCFKKI